MRYAEVGTREYDYYDEEGQAIDGFATEAVDRRSTFGEAVAQLVLKSTDRTYGHPNILMTTRRHWSGYSEYTITNTWSEIILTVPEWNWEQEWPSLGDFLRALADANPEADR